MALYDYYTIDGVKLDEKDVDLTKGSRHSEERVKKHHPAIPAVPEKGHYWPDHYYFEDGSEYTVSGPDDPHVVVLPGTNLDFGFNDVDGEYDSEVYGKNITWIIDQEGVPGQEAWDEMEHVYIYEPYTPEQLAEKEEEQKKAEQTQEFMEVGPDQLTQNTADIEALTEVFAETLGVE